MGTYSPSYYWCLLSLLPRRGLRLTTAFSTPKAAWGRACSFAGGATPAYKKSIHNKLMLNQLLELGYLLLLALDNREKFFLLRLQFLLKRSNLFVFCL